MWSDDAQYNVDTVVYWEWQAGGGDELQTMEHVNIFWDNYFKNIF